MKYNRINKELFIQNRKNFVAQMEPDSVAIFNSNDIYPISADSTMPFQQHRDIFYLSGVDILSSDRLGRLNVTLDGCRLRDEFVFEYCKNRSLPISVSMGGGYSLSLNDIVSAHANTFRVAVSLYCFL